MEALFGIALIALVCPLMMWFMMRGMHGSTSGHADHKDSVGHEDPAPGSQTAEVISPGQKLQALEQEIEALKQEVSAARQQGKPLE